MNLHAYISLIRPINGIIAFISVFLGAFLVDSSLMVAEVIKVLIVAVAAFLFLSAGNVLNDIHDAKTDLVNKPFRPIPSGQVGKRSSLTFSVIMFIIGLILGSTVSIIAFLVAVLVVLLLVLYTYVFRKVPLIGNIVVSILTGLTFISGGIAVRSITKSIIPAIFAFLFTLGREIVKDIQDVRGDVHSGMTSLPIRFGERKSIFVVYMIISLLIFTTPVPYLIGMYSLYYLITVVFGVDIVLIYCMFVLSRNPIDRNAGIVAKLMKFDIFISLGAIYLGKLGPRLL